MNHIKAEKYLLAKPESILDYPFGLDAKVFKVKGKMFATLALGKMGKGDGKSQDWWMNLKCDPDEASALRDIFASVIPGYHMNNSVCNTHNININVLQCYLKLTRLVVIPRH